MLVCSGFLQNVHDLLDLLRIVEHTSGGAEPLLPVHLHELPRIGGAQFAAHLVHLGLLFRTKAELIVFVEGRRLVAGAARVGLHLDQLATGIVQSGEARFVCVSRIGAGGEQSLDGGGAGARAAHIGDQRRAAFGGGTVRIDSPAQPLSHKVGVAALGRQVKKLLKAAAVLRMPCHLPKIVHADDCIPRTRKTGTNLGIAFPKRGVARYDSNQCQPAKKRPSFYTWIRERPRQRSLRGPRTFCGAAGSSSFPRKPCTASVRTRGIAKRWSASSPPRGGRPTIPSSCTQRTSPRREHWLKHGPR